MNWRESTAVLLSSLSALAMGRSISLHNRYLVNNDHKVIKIIKSLRAATNYHIM